MENEVKHFGVLGMRWGRRKAQDSTPKSIGRRNMEKSLDDVRRVYGNKGSKKKAKDMTDEEIDNEIARISSGPIDKKTAKRIDKENKRLEKEAKDYTRDEAIANARRAEARAHVEELVALSSKQKNFDEKKEREWAENFFGDELKTSVNDIRQERAQRGALAVTFGLLAIGNIAVNLYSKHLTNQIQKQVAESITRGVTYL